ncbi:hypothetical protein MMC11_001945 [Xylographa trunciseda]|nr:hypothetical protein [Xylographa trunciseda]
MHFTPATALSILAFTATTTSAYSHLYSHLGARSPHDLDSLYERDAAARFSISRPKHHPKPDADPKPKPSSSSSPSSHALSAALAFVQRLRAGTLQVASGDVGKLLGVACDANSIASLFDAGSAVATDVSNGVAVACTAGQIVKVAAGAKLKRWEGYRRAAEAEAEARADADAFEEHGMVLAARWAVGLED